MISTGENSRFFHQSSGKPTSSHLVENQEEHAEGNDEFSSRNIFFFAHRSDFLHSIKSCDMGLTALFPLRRKACCGFLSPIKSIASAGFEPVNFGSNGKHANHYTTETAHFIYLKSTLI
jgi:hypothetical protein